MVMKVITAEPICKVHISSKKNWAFKWNDLTSGLLRILLNDLMFGTRKELTLKLKRTNIHCPYKRAPLCFCQIMKKQDGKPIKWTDGTKVKFAINSRQMVSYSNMSKQAASWHPNQIWQNWPPDGSQLNFCPDWPPGFTNSHWRFNYWRL